MDFQTITIKDYLTQKDIPFVERNGELTTKCLFGNCDIDSRGNEAHLYFNADSGLYDCKKCGSQGNIVTLAKHLGDSVENITLHPIKSNKFEASKNAEKITDELVEKYHLALPDHILQYLNVRGITDEVIRNYQIGWGQFYGKLWITIPVKDDNGDWGFFKLRQDPEDTFSSDKYKFFPVGSKATIFNSEMLKGNEDDIVICEGEFDCMLLNSKGIPAITSTAGVAGFKEEWIEKLNKLKRVYICFDKDEAGEKGVERIISMIENALPKIAICKTTFPERMTNGKDVTDYFIKYAGNPDELIKECSKQVAGKLPIDASKFEPITTKNIVEILGLTIKQDEENKLITFMCCLSAYTEQAQLNISFNAPSSTGKSFIPLEIASLFPKEDVMKLGDCSPKAFFHEQGAYDKEKNTTLVDLSRKILIFLDQPHNALLERLRSLLSHDQKEMISKITDKNAKGGNKTKTVILRGYPSVIFCSAGLKIDEQESTRFILLSPETSQEKFRFAIQEKIKKEADYDTYLAKLNSNPDRQLLKQRIEAIKQEHIDEIRIGHPEKIEQVFLSKRTMLKPRHQRDIGRLLGITKIFALLNVWFREREGSTIIANDEDIAEAVKLWEKISKSQEYNLPPYIYNLYNEVILLAYAEKNDGMGFGEVVDKQGITRQDIFKKHFDVYGRMVEDFRLRQQILPMLETAGLITQEQDPDNKRRVLIYPTTQLTVSSEPKDIVSDSGE